MSSDWCCFGALASCAELETAGEVSSLREICRSAIRKAVTIQRFSQMETLPLPDALLRPLQALCLANFHIRFEEVMDQHHAEGRFPATCMFDGTKVCLNLSQQDNDEMRRHPLQLATFLYGNITIVITSYTKSLAEIIAKASLENTPLAERDIWQVVLKSADIAVTLDPTQKLGPLSLHYCDSDLVYCPHNPQNESERLVMSLYFYDAPEVLARQAASEYAHSWAIGCIAYEMMALKPALLEPNDDGDRRAVARKVADGKRPALDEFHGKYSNDLINLVSQCMKLKARERPTLASIITLALERLR